MGNIFLSAHNDLSNHVDVRVVLVVSGNIFLIYWHTLEIAFKSFDLRELACVFLYLDCWMACEPKSKGAYSYVFI